MKYRDIWLPGCLCKLFPVHIFGSFCNSIDPSHKSPIWSGTSCYLMTSTNHCPLMRLSRCGMSVINRMGMTLNFSVSLIAAGLGLIAYCFYS